jgi:hypothetical protein
MAKTDTSVIPTDINVVATIRQRHAALTSEIAKLEEVLATLGDGESEPAPKPRKQRGRPSKAGGKRGRPKGSKNKASKAEPKASSGKRGRPKGSTNKGVSLIHAVAQVLAEASEPMTVADIASAVNKLGYKSGAASFKTMISQSLGRLSAAKVARSTERGIWESAAGITKYLENLAADEAAESQKESSEAAAEEITV